MFTFLNSAILFGLAAIAIPILIHLFTRQKNKVEYFSSLKFLKELQKQKIRRLKIRQILLLILRTLAILMLVLAFARPTLRSSNSSALESGAQITAVIILDNTLSMGRVSEGKRLLDEAKKNALQLVSQLRQGDEIYLLYPQNPAKFAHEGARYNLDTVRELIQQTELSYSKTDYLAALTLANGIMLNSSNINKEVYLIADLQRNGLKPEDQKNGHSLLDENVNLFVLPIIKKSKQNLAVADISLGNQILEKGKVVEVVASVKNLSKNTIKNKLAHLFLNGKRLGQDLVNLEPQSTTNLKFKIVPHDPGFQAGYVLLEDDALLEDNRRYITFNMLDEIAVLIVGNHPEDSYYINLALRPQKETISYIKSKEIHYKELVREDLKKYYVVVFSNVPKFSAAEVQKVHDYVSSGGGLMVFLGADVDLRNYNEGMHKRLKLPSFTQPTSTTGDTRFLSLGKIDFSHPIFQGVFENEKFVESPHIKFAVNITTTAPLEKIIEYSNGNPFLFESKFREGKVLYLTTGVSEEDSDIAFRSIFVPLVNRCVTYLAGGTSLENQSLLIGEEITYSLGRSGSGKSLFMERPDGSQIKLKPDIVRGNYFIKFNASNLPGIYKLLSDEKIVSQWAINIDPIESRVETFTVDELKEVTGIKQISEINDLQQIDQQLVESRFGSEFWKVFIILALCFILIETILLREKTLKKQNA